MSARFVAPPGHLSQAEVLILSSLVDNQLTLDPPDPDLKVWWQRAGQRRPPGRLPPAFPVRPQPTGALPHRVPPDMVAGAMPDHCQWR